MVAEKLLAQVLGFTAMNNRPFLLLEEYDSK